MRAWQQAEHLRRWGGREPTALLQQVERDAIALAAEHRDLVDAIAALGPSQQRSLAIALATDACARDDGPVTWTPALAALETRQPLPPPFDDPEAVRMIMFGSNPRFTAFIVTTTRSGSLEPKPRQPIHAGVTAEATVRAAADDHPLSAALRAVHTASWSAANLADYFSDVLDKVKRLEA